MTTNISKPSPPDIDLPSEPWQPRNPNGIIPPCSAVKTAISGGALPRFWDPDDKQWSQTLICDFLLDAGSLREHVWESVVYVWLHRKLERSEREDEAWQQGVVAWLVCDSLSLSFRYVIIPVVFSRSVIGTFVRRLVLLRCRSSSNTGTRCRPAKSFRKGIPCLFRRSEEFLLF